MQPKKSCVGWKLGRSIRKNERKKSKKSKKIEKNNFFSNQARSIGNRLKKTLEKNRVIICSQKKVGLAGSWVVRFEKMSSSSYIGILVFLAMFGVL